MDFNLPFFLMDLFAFVLGVTVHEFGHAIAADRLGDDTPRRQDRISLSPLDHLDPAGTIMFVLSAIYGTPFGWGKPVITYPAHFKNPRRDSMIVSFAGPIMNVVLAVIFAMAVRFGTRILPDTSVYFQLLCRCVQVNILLFLFNMIPLPPLDGSKILAGILPDNQSRSYEKMMRQWGYVLFFVLFFAGGRVIGPMVDRWSDLLSNTQSAPAILIGVR